MILDYRSPYGCSFEVQMGAHSAILAEAVIAIAPNGIARHTADKIQCSDAEWKSERLLPDKLAEGVGRLIDVEIVKVIHDVL